MATLQALTDSILAQSGVVATQRLCFTTNGGGSPPPLGDRKPILGGSQAAQECEAEAWFDYLIAYGKALLSNDPEKNAQKAYEEYCRRRDECAKL